MIADALRKFSKQTFSEKTFPVLHGETAKIQPGTLAVKKHRSVWKRPYAKLEMVILAELRKYVKPGEEIKALSESFQTKIKEEVFVLKQEIDKNKIDVSARAEERHEGVEGCLEGTIKLGDGQGDLKLGKLRQHYIEDADLRKILAETILDPNKMKNFDRHALLLITSVIYSEKFELKGKRLVKTGRQVELAEMEHLCPFLRYILRPSQLTQVDETYRPPEVATRTSEAPFLFKCCHVEFNKETNRLEIREGEFIKKIVVKDEFKEEYQVDSDEEEDEDGHSFVDLYGQTDEADLIDYFTKDDFQNLDKILQDVLLPCKSRKQRKALVEKYLSWFETALTTEQKEIQMKEPITSDDVTFLSSVVSVPYIEGSTKLDLSDLEKKQIHGFGIIFKVLHDLPDEQWKEIEDQHKSNTKK